MNTYHQLREILLAQGIVRAASIYPAARLVDDLAYDASDIAELVRMAERTFAVQIEPDEHQQFTSLSAVVTLLNSKQIRRDQPEAMPDYASLD